MNSKHTFNNEYRTFAEINLDAIDNNLSELKARMKEGVKTMAVVKADAYGHGAERVSLHIENRVDYFAVATVEEAVELRHAGIKKPILILSYTLPAAYGELIDNDITATIYNYDEAAALSEIALAKGKKVRVHIAVDTGMGRIGFAPNEESADIVKKISELEGITLEGLFSHYACADCADKADANAQTKLFDAFTQLLEKKNVNIPIKHICNSAGTMDFDKQYDMCRIGIALYGLYPSDEMDKSKITLTPAMQVKSHVIHINQVEKGTKIGYGHIYEAPASRKIATVSIGYADGFNRCLTNCGYVLINGKKAAVVGKVCMDMIMVDITDIENVSVGDIAVILGSSGSENISAEALGEMAHSFNYEVVCNFMPRVKRIYCSK